MLKPPIKQAGFTIVELLIVIVIIGILAAITIVAYNGIQQRAHVAALQSDLKNASNQLGIDNVNNGIYPASIAAANGGQGLKASPGTTWQYTYTSAGNSYCITGTNSSVSYFSSTANPAPQAGACPGDVNGGVATLTYTLTISAGANGTVNTGVNGDYASGATPTITATPNATYVLSTWSGSTGCSGVASHTITMDDNKTCTANFVADPWANWYSGIAATALAGKHVYKADLGSMQYKTTADAVTSPQGATGLDPNYPSNMVLVSPQTNSGVDFSAYPAQNACKAIGGRLPNMQELLAIYAGSATYGNNFQANYYWSSTEYDSANTYGVYFSGGSTVYLGKTYNFYVRCVSG